VKELRPYQLDVLAKLYPLIEQREHVVVTMPTGAGKTRIAADVFTRVREANHRSRSAQIVHMIANAALRSLNLI
jgi:superfamily II DNA or RNA helicase